MEIRKSKIIDRKGISAHGKKGRIIGRFSRAFAFL